MNREPVRIPGWSDEQWTGYVAGWAKADARLDEITRQPISTLSSPPGSPVPADPFEARALALIAQSDAADAAVAARRLADPSAVQVTVTERPGDPPSVEERRRWALAGILESGTVVIRPGDEPPKQDWVMTTPDGATAVRAPVTQMTVITPENADEVDRQFSRARRHWENKLLAGKYGEKACRAAGIIP